MNAPRRAWRLLAAAAALVLLASCSALSRAAYPYRPAGPARPRPRASETERPVSLPVSSALSVRTASYWGIYEPGTPGSYQPVQRFTALMGGAAPRIVLYFSDWGQPFDTGYALTAHGHHAVTLVQIQPADVSVAGIAAGRFDGYLRSYANQVRAFGYPVIIGFAHEMNGNWYSWGFGHVAPRVWIAAWRHVVTVFREQRADNVTWLWTVNITAPGIGSPRQWWPGSAYATWVGIDGYFYLAGDSFQGVLTPTITDVRSFTSKPILIAETGITPGFVPGAMPGLVAGIRQSHLLGLVWFDAVAGLDWRLEGHPGAVAAFRSGIGAMLGGADGPQRPG